MLHIPTKIHFPLPQFKLAHRIDFAMISIDDELTKSIDDQADINENNWQLSEQTDPEDLSREWADVIEDVRKDPDWSNFTRED